MKKQVFSHILSLIFIISIFNVLPTFAQTAQTKGTRQYVREIKRVNLALPENQGKFLKLKKKNPISRTPQIIGYEVRPMSSSELLSIIHKTARDWNIDPKLFENLIRKESAGKICANSQKGARGITQLMPPTARAMGLRVDSQVDERCDLLRSLYGGAKYFRFQLDTFKDVRLALAGYNAGEGAVIKYGYRIPPYRETAQYVELICAWTYGKSGMSLDIAYNYNLAYKFAVNAYANRKPLIAGLGDFSKQTEVVSPQSILTKNSPEEKVVKVKEDAGDNIKSEEMPKEIPRKVIRLTELEPKLKTGSLLFKNINN